MKLDVIYNEDCIGKKGIIILPDKKYCKMAKQRLEAERTLWDIKDKGREEISNGESAS